MTVPVRCAQRAVPLGASQVAIAGSPSRLRDLRVAVVDWMSGPSGGRFRATDAGPRARHQKEGHGQGCGTRTGIGRTNGWTPTLAKESVQAVPTGANTKSLWLRGARLQLRVLRTIYDDRFVGCWAVDRGDQERGTNVAGALYGRAASWEVRWFVVS